MFILLYIQLHISSLLLPMQFSLFELSRWGLFLFVKSQKLRANRSPNHLQREK